MDEVAIFNVAISEENINELMENGRGGTLAVDLAGKAATTWTEIKRH